MQLHSMLLVYIIIWVQIKCKGCGRGHRPTTFLLLLHFWSSLKDFVFCECASEFFLIFFKFGITQLFD